jgi:hypothetical protein
VVLDLKRMNRILEVNDRKHYAPVEPGVSYFDLYQLEALWPLGGEVAFGCRRGHVASGRALRAATQ